MPEEIPETESEATTVATPEVSATDTAGAGAPSESAVATAAATPHRPKAKRPEKKEGESGAAKKEVSATADAKEKKEEKKEEEKTHTKKALETVASKATELGKTAWAATIPMLQTKTAKGVGLVLAILAAAAVAAPYGIDALRDCSNSRIAAETPKKEIEFDVETQMEGRKMNIVYLQKITIDDCGELHQIMSFVKDKPKIGKGKFYRASALITVKTHDGKILTYKAESIAANQERRTFHVTATLAQ